MRLPVIYVVDAGSVDKGNFHWVSSEAMERSHADPAALAGAIAADLLSDKRVALGYESPLFAPLDADPSCLGLARKGECQKETGNRPFTAGAGASVLATGVQSLAWVLRRVHELAGSVASSTRWQDFRSGACALFVWEAFVSGSEKAFPASHAGDAALAIEAFQKIMHQDANPTRINATSAISFAGAALLASGLSTDLSLLNEPCVVLRPIFSPEESALRLESYRTRQATSNAGKKKRPLQPSGKVVLVQEE